MECLLNRWAYGPFIEQHRDEHQSEPFSEQQVSSCDPCYTENQDRTRLPIPGYGSPMPSEEQRAEVAAELKRRRNMVVMIGVLGIFSVVVIAPFLPWWAVAAFAAVFLLALGMGIARYRQIVAAVKAAGY